MKTALVLSACLILATGCSRPRSKEAGYVDLESHSLEVRFAKSSRDSPTVVMESGLGGKIQGWETVQHMVSEHASVVCYQRAGTGGSQPGPRPRDAATIADELHRMLQALDAKPPYLLVGHSVGGIYVRHFADRFPESVCGIVLVDPTMEFQNELSRSQVRSTLREQWPDHAEQIDSLLTRLHPKMAPLAAHSMLEMAPYFQRFPEEVRTREKDAWFELIADRAQQIEGMLGFLTDGERQELFASMASMESVRNKILSVPLVLLAAGRVEPPKKMHESKASELLSADYLEWANDTRVTRYRDFVQSQPNAKLTIVEQAGHNIHRDRPDVVAQAIVDMLSRDDSP